MIERIEDETVVYDLRSKEAHCLKPLAAVVFERCDGRATASEIAATAETRLGEPVSAEQVRDAATQLERLGLLETSVIVHDGNGFIASSDSDVSRREMIRRVGFAGAAAATATTLVTTIAAPAALAVSGAPTGCPCTKNKDCMSGHCCQDNGGKGCNQTCCVAGNNSCHLNGTICVGGANNGTAGCTTNADCPGGVCNDNCTVCASDFVGGCPNPPPVCAGGATPCNCVVGC